MLVKLVSYLTVLCVVIATINSEKSYDGRSYTEGYTRVKRGKYYSNPSQRLYGPPTSPNKGIFSHPAPSNYDKKPQYSAPASHLRPPKVSNRPTNNGLGDEDINNIVKHLSRQDLEKIIELAGSKDRDSGTYDFEKHIEYSSPPNDEFKSSLTTWYDHDAEKFPIKSINDDDSKIFKTFIQEFDTDTDANTNIQEPFSIEYSRPDISSINYVTQPTPAEAYFDNYQNNDNLYDTAALAVEESMLQKEIAYLQSQINDGIVYTDSKLMPEENLPKPMNLREDQDYDVSYTNNVPTVVKAEPSSSYKLENFGELPIMDYDSKLDSVSSYHVPHYSVTSSSKPLSPPAYIPPPSKSLPYGVRVPTLEPAPPPSAAKVQSDAHLKAVRIWSHMSKGTAYTLHDDGSLSLEKPGRPKGTYGYP